MWERDWNAGRFWTFWNITGRLVVGVRVDGNTSNVMKGRVYPYVNENESESNSTAWKATCGVLSHLAGSLHVFP